MYYNIGDKVVFIDRNSKRIKHKLIKNKIYEVYDILKHLGTPLDEQKLYYGVLDDHGIVTTWYEKEDFITLNEFRIKNRNEKLKKLMKLLPKSPLSRIIREDTIGDCTICH